MSEETQGGGFVGLIFGLVIGGALGFGWSHYLDGSLWGIVVGGLVVGILGFVFGDRFWLWLGRNFRHFT
jgi:O-antigen/teichoic acid export membrane protein